MRENVDIEKHLPNPFYFDHVLVYVPRQDGISADIWIDATQEDTISFIEIPSSLLGRKVLIPSANSWRILKISKR